MFEKLKSLSKDTLIYGTSTIVGRFLNFLLVPIYTNIFLPQDFGIVANVYAYIAILNVFFSIGLESGYFKFASTLEVGDAKENFSHPFLGILLNSFVISTILFIFARQFTPLFQIAEEKYLIIQLTAIILFFDAICLVPFAYLRLDHKPKKFALIRIINIVINVLFTVILIVILRVGIIGVFLSNVIASVFTFVFLSPIVIRNLTLRFNRKLIVELLRFSIPYIPAGISSNIVQVINRPILTALTNDATVGIFQANYRLGIFMMLFVQMFEFAWRPFFLTNAKESNAKEIFSRVMTFFLVIGSFIFIVLSLFVEYIAKIKLPFKGYLIGKAYWDGLYIVPLILLSYLFYGVYINLMAGIYIEKKTKYLPYITGFAALINVIVNFVLIPLIGMLGAALATLSSYVVMMLGIYYVSQKFYPIKYEYGNILKIVLSVTFSFVLFYLIVGGIDGWYIRALIVLLFISMLFIFRVIKIEHIKKILNVRAV
ncbi:MAG: oligosaccharide flippase family protein [Ignavibacteria bacterium]